MQPDVSLIEQFANGTATLTQKVGAVGLVVALILGVWWLFESSRRKIENQAPAATETKPCATCYRELTAAHYRGYESPFCLECEAWFSRRDPRPNCKSEKQNQIRRHSAGA